MNKDVKKPVNLFDVIKGEEQSDNPDDIAFSSLSSMNSSKGTKTGDDDDDMKIELVAQVTQIPDEAIVVLLDISGSMEAQFFECQDLERMGAVKAFFNAFADRTMAYNLKNVI